MIVRKELQEAVDRLLAQRRETAHQELHTRMEGLYRHCPALAELEREQAALLRELTAVALKKKSGDPAALRAPLCRHRRATRRAAAGFGLGRGLSAPPLHLQQVSGHRLCGREALLLLPRRAAPPLLRDLSHGALAAPADL